VRARWSLIWLVRCGGLQVLAMNQSLLRRRGSLMSLVLNAAALAGCSRSQSLPSGAPSSAQQLAQLPPMATAEPVTSVPAALASTAFAAPNGVPATTFAAIRDLTHAQANFAVSTYSLERCLAILALGAKGKTLQELQAYLHTDNVATWLAKSAASASVGRGQVTLQESNGVWTQNGLALVAEYQRDIAANKGTVAGVDFRTKPEEARKHINAKVAEQTQGKIPELLPNGIIKPSTRVVLTNAIYFLGAWQTPFALGRTRPEAFTTSDGQSVQVPMMHADIAVAGGRYTLGPAAGQSGIAASLPYAGSSYALLLVVPDGPLAAFENGLAGDTVPALAKTLKTVGQFALAIPKFEIRSGGFVHTALAKVGLDTALSVDADYHGIVAQEALTVSAVVHQVFIKVEEKGTEAAAATAVVMGPGGMAPKTTPLRFDKPFFFAVYNKDSGATLFSGHVGNPLENAGATSARAPAEPTCYTVAKAREFASPFTAAPAPFAACADRLKMHCGGADHALCGFDLDRDATARARKSAPDSCCYPSGEN
jgi:serpin B